MSKQLKQTYFQNAWLSHPAYSKWVCKAVINTKARCKLCQSDIALSNMGINALKSHSEKSVRHKELVMQKTLRENFFKKKSSQYCSSGSINQESINSKAQEVQGMKDKSVDVITNRNLTQGTISGYFLDGGKINAEIR